jgi:prepilin-type N-terminal cleavage/methylation domain-containing protein
MQKEYFKNKRGGFTIIEVMISIALFTIVIMTGMTALLNVNSLHNKSQNTRSIMDSLNFIMEDMSRNIRTGYNYSCFPLGAGFPNSGQGSPQDCTDGSGEALAFESSTGDPSDDKDQVIYAFDSNGNLFKAIDGGYSNDIYSSPINPSNVTFITGSGFTVVGSKPGDDQQPFVIIRLVGEITNKDKTKTQFSLQTSVSQRLIDIPAVSNPY